MATMRKRSLLLILAWIILWLAYGGQAISGIYLVPLTSAIALIGSIISVATNKTEIFIPLAPMFLATFAAERLGLPLP